MTDAGPLSGIKPRIPLSKPVLLFNKTTTAPMAGKAGQPSLPPWGNALAGATGAVLANAIVYPLDMQVVFLKVYAFHCVLS